MPDMLEDDLARRFAEEHADELRYVAAWRKWLIWDGERWAEDRTLAVADRARELVRRAAAEAGSKRKQREIVSARMIAAIVWLARSDRRLAATADEGLKGQERRGGRR